MSLLRLTATLAFGLALAGQASAGTSLVVDAATGQVLSSENANQPWHPASTTKLMTAYLALKAVREGRLGLETAIPASKRAASQPRVKVYIKAGQEITLDNALRIMMVKSANDIAYVIAEGVGGDVETFVGMMNTEARRLGMRETRFVNPNGWHHPDQQVSARDLAILAMALMHDFPDYADYWNTASVQLGKQVLHNTNGLVGRYPGVNGMKTGFVCASGFNVVTSATRGGRTLIAVVLGALSGTERTVKAAQLLDDGFGKWGGTGQTVSSFSTGGGSAPNICDDLRRKGGGVALADDAESSGPISAQAPNLGGNADDGGRFATASAPAQTSGSMLTRTPSGRVVLGPRAETVPVPVAFGRTPGSDRAPLAANASGGSDSRVARGSAPVVTPSAPVQAGLFGAGTPGLFGDSARRSASAFAPPSQADAPADGGASSGPLRLQGAITPGSASPASLRPSSSAAIKPPARPTAQNAKPAAKPTDKAAKPKPPQAKPSQAKPSQAKPSQAKDSQAKAGQRPGQPTAPAKAKAGDDA